MIRTVTVEINSAYPEMPLERAAVYTGSAVSFTILNVPRRHGKREITGVSISLTNPSGTITTKAATRDGSAWNVTIPSSAVGVPGNVTNGVIVSASGKMEDGETDCSWILGVGDLAVLNQDGTSSPDAPRQIVHVFSTVPNAPVFGDIAVVDSVLKIRWSDNTWKAMGGGGSITLDNEVTQLSSNGVKSSGIWSFVHDLLDSLTISWTSITGKPSTFPPSSHQHAKADITDFPTSMTPTSHASTHEVDGGDEVTLAQSQVTGLVDALDGKAPSTNIAKTALAQDVQTSLGKADAARSKADFSANKFWSDENASPCLENATPTLVVTPNVGGGYVYYATGLGNGWQVTESLGGDTEHPQYLDFSVAGLVSGETVFGHLYMRRGNLLVGGLTGGVANDPEVAALLATRATTADITSAVSTHNAANDAHDGVLLKVSKLAAAYLDSSAYAVGAFCSHGGGIYQCTTAISAPGEAWNAAHWSARDVSSLFTSANTSLTGQINYTIGASGNPADHTVRTLGTLASATTLTIAAPRTAGALRDFAITFTEPATAVGVTFSTTDAAGSSLTFYGEFLTPADGKTYIYYLTEIAANTFLVKGEEIATITPPTI